MLQMHVGIFIALKKVFPPISALGGERLGSTPSTTKRTTCFAYVCVHSLVADVGRLEWLDQRSVESLKWDGKEWKAIQGMKSSKWEAGAEGLRS